MKILRAGNIGIIDPENGQGSLYSFTMGKGWQPSSFMLSGHGLPDRKLFVNGTAIIPYGFHNDFPQRVDALLGKFYAGEGIISKVTGLQWGQGPAFYQEEVDAVANKFVRKWVEDDLLGADLRSWTGVQNWKQFVRQCAGDYNHLGGFFVKIYRNRAPRVGGAGRLAKMEFVSARKARLLYPADGSDRVPGVMVGNFPFNNTRYTYNYPLFDPNDPFRHPVSMAYYKDFTFGQDYYAVPKFMGAWEWLELAGGLAEILKNYNANSSSISLHIESPQSYWDKAEERIKARCVKEGREYSPKMLEDFKQAAMEKFAANITGSENAGKYLHTSKEFDAEADSFVGWTVTPVDKKLKDYVDAQIKIANKADAAATSGFGLDPVLANLIMENKLSSGSEKLYSLKVHMATETAIPDMVICQPLQEYIAANFPGSATRVGFYRPVVDAEQNVSPDNRVKSNQ